MRTAVVLTAMTFALQAGCTRTHPAAPRAPASSSRTEARTEAHTEAHRSPVGESGSQEIMERQPALSPFAPDATGLRTLLTEVVRAASQRDRTRLGELLAPLLPRRDVLRLAVDFEGDRILLPYLTGPNGPVLDAWIDRALAWSGTGVLAIEEATGAQIAQRGPASVGMDARMREVAPYLRPGATFYRATLGTNGSPREPVVLEVFVFAGGRWQFLEQPWRALPGSPERAQTVPAPRWGARIPAAQ